MATTNPAKPGSDLIKRRHPEFLEHQLRWKWLLDSLEGGERYRQAVYGTDHRGQPVRNLVRHKREYPEPTAAGTNGYGHTPGADPLTPATDDDYELRRARTPVPTFVAEAISDHLDRVYAREVKRVGPADLTAWWDDVDGRETRIDTWLRESVAPALLACGQLDVLMDHPAAPEGADVRTKADVDRLGLGRCVASYILPENMVWWRLDAAGRYAECLVREYPCGDDAEAQGVRGRDPARYRHWTAEGSTLYGGDGEEIETRPHAFRRVPIARLFARRKPRCENVGQPPYEGVAERQREYYNRDSELILSDTTQAHPLLQGPEDYVQADGTIPIGPSWLLPKKRDSQHGTYEGFDVVQFPKDGAESIRTNKNDLRDAIDRDTATLKPAGSAGGTVSQSGISKGFDNERLNNKLSGLADALASAEKCLAELALTVLGDGPATLPAFTVEYSKQFDLTDVEDMGAFLGSILGLVANPAASAVPKIAGEFLRAMVRQALPGREDATYSAWDAEIDAAVAAAKANAEPVTVPGATMPGGKPAPKPKPKPPAGEAVAK